VAAGDRALGKERVELFGGGGAAVLDDYRALELHRGGRTQRDRNRLRQDKGHQAEWEAIGRSLRAGGAAPIALDALVATSLATFAAVRALRTGDAEPLDAVAWLRELRAAEPASKAVTGEPAGAGTG
jgi:hypothetical protein